MSAPKKGKWSTHLKGKDRLLFWVRYAENGCWIWKGGLSKSGCGVYAIDGHTNRGNVKLLSAYRAAWELWNGPVPEGKQLNHKCDDRRCVNPDHLYVGTQSDNCKDREERNPRPRCPSTGQFLPRQVAA